MTTGRLGLSTPIGALLALLALTGGCGQTGPLFLPDEGPANGAGALPSDGSGANDNGADEDANDNERRSSGAAR